MVSDFKLDLVMMTSQRRSNFYLIGNPAVHMKFWTKTTLARDCPKLEFQRHKKMWPNGTHWRPKSSLSHRSQAIGTIWLLYSSYVVSTQKKNRALVSVDLYSSAVEHERLVTLTKARPTHKHSQHSHSFSPYRWMVFLSIAFFCRALLEVGQLESNQVSSLFAGATVVEVE